MYNQSAQWSSRRRYTHPVRGAERRERMAARERVRLLQLAVCAVLFTVVFVGKGVFPQRLAQLQGELQSVLSSDTDFRAALADLGESLSGQESVLGGLAGRRLGGLCQRRAKLAGGLVLLGIAARMLWTYFR